MTPVPRIAIVDTGGANLASLRHACARLGRKARVTSDPEAIRLAHHVILPGVGAARPAMKRLEEGALGAVVRGLRQPVLGICLGMQLLFEESEEGGSVPCLGLLPGRVRALACGSLSVPHMGWNQVEWQPGSALFAGLERPAHFYFVHSFAAQPTAAMVASCTYGTRFPAAVCSANFHGVQFHPERSGAAGAKLLENFFRL